MLEGDNVFVPRDDADAAAAIIRATIATQNPGSAGVSLSTTPNGIANEATTNILRAAGGAVERTEAAKDTINP